MTIKIWKDKDGKWITLNEFITRFKQGYENITPIQKLFNDLNGTFITLLGFIFSFMAVIWFREKIGLLSYGLILIFIGSIWTTGVKWIALKHQYKMLKEMESQIENYTEMKGGKKESV